MKWKLLKWSLTLVLFVGACSYGIYQACQLRWNTEMPVSVDLVVVEPGDNLVKIIDGLNAETEFNQLLWWLKVWLRIHPEAANIHVGTYKMDEMMTPAQIAERLRSGQEHQYRVTLVEGETFAQWWQQLNDTPGIVASEYSEAELAAYLGASNSKLEGLLLPETYYYTDNTPAEQIAKRAYQAMEKVLNEAWVSRQANLPLNDQYELLILASIIEKETAVADERDKVASVFVNRLNKKMRLQTDPTVIYGMGDRYQGNIRRADLREATPYNTYVIPRLPPTPIAMPSAQSIVATANPQQSPYFYFVANGEGGHYFSKTLSEHNRAVRKYILNQ